MDFTSLKDILEFIVALITVAGFTYTTWRFVIKKFLYEPFIHHCEKIKEMASTVETINTEILPVIQSLSREFSKNSGKSIMDRISRIDDNTRLAELRSKLIASNLVTTGMIEFDRAGRLTWANKALINMCGVSLDELRNNGWTIIIEESDRNHVWDLWQTSLKHDIPFESEFSLKNQNTNIQKSIKCTVYPHKSVEGIVLGYYGTIIEIP